MTYQQMQTRRVVNRLSDGETASLELARAALGTLVAELSALSRLQDADELRRRAGWAAADADAALALLPVQS